MQPTGPIASVCHGITEDLLQRRDAQYSEVTLVLLGHGQTILGQPHGTLGISVYLKRITRVKLWPPIMNF